MLPTNQTQGSGRGAVPAAGVWLGGGGPGACGHLVAELTAVPLLSWKTSWLK